jgi:putative membrane protein
MYNVRDAAFGGYMTRTTQLVCCAVLSVASSLIPSKARAQSDDDKKFLAMAAQSDQNEIALSKLAEQKATNPAVKAFAEKMITEHTQMTASMKPFVDAWGLTPPTGPDADHQKELDKLTGLSGNDFDKAYMKDMVSDHSKALSAFTKEANDTKDAKFRAVVIKGKTAVAAHKNMAYDLEKKL